MVSLHGYTKRSKTNPSIMLLPFELIIIDTNLKKNTQTFKRNGQNEKRTL